MLNLWPFKRRKHAQSTQKSESTAFEIEYISADMLRIRELNFLGYFAKSPSTHYMIAWSDSDRILGDDRLVSTRGGHREKGCGAHILFKDDKIIMMGQFIERPENGKVADNGTCILNDIKFNLGFGGTFYAFILSESSNVSQFKQNFRGNLSNNGLSSDGRYAACYIAGEQSEKLAFFDVPAHEVLWKKTLQTGQPESYEFDIDHNILYTINERGKFRYSFDGKFLDKEAWEQSQHEHANGFELTRLVERKLAQCKRPVTPENSQDILQLLNIAQQRFGERYPSYRAKALRTMGELYEELGDISQAIVQYELALQYDSKVGVKRKLNQLKTGGNG